MSGLRHIRKRVLELSQSELGKVAGVTQATVSRWERGELHPNLSEMQRIRDEAMRRRLPWHDEWFFASPTAATAASAEPARIAS